MKTKEQIIEWLKSQEWYMEFCEKAGFHNEQEFIEYVECMMNRTKDIMSGAFLWPEYERNFWHQCEDEYLKWLNSEDEKPKESKSEDRFIFDRGSKAAPFYMVYAEGKSSPTFKHGSMEEATKEADRLAKSLNTKTYVLAAVMEIRPEIVTSAAGIDDMEHEEDYPF